MRRSLLATATAVGLLLGGWPATATDAEPTPTPTPSPTATSSPVPDQTQEPSPPSDPEQSPTPSPEDGASAQDDEASPVPEDPLEDGEIIDRLRPGGTGGSGAVRVAPGGDACSRGEYGELLDDGTVDVGCDGVLSFGEQRSPVTLRIEVRARPGEQVAVTVDERDVAGTVLRVDPVSTRGGSVERFPLLYRAPDGLDGRDGFSLWVSRDGYEREVRVVLDVSRSGLAGAAAPPRGVLLGGDDGEVAVALAPGRVGALGPVTVVLGLIVLGLLVLLAVWTLLRRRGVVLPVLDEQPDRPSSTTFVAGR